jgi:cytochrome c oxidase subunit 4
MMTTSTEHEHPSGSARLYVWVWVWLVTLTALEVILAFQALQVAVMLLLLVSLSLVKAGLIISYFMHLVHEKRSLKLSLIPPLILVIVLLFVFFPDSIRLNELKP